MIERNNEIEAARAALKVAHHALNSVHGLWASDLLAKIGTASFRIDTLKAIEAIEEVLEDARTGGSARRGDGLEPRSDP